MTSVRKEIERNIRAYHGRINENEDAGNRELTKEQLQIEWDRKIAEMDIMELIRYAHPEDRGNFARKAMAEELITKEQAKEFIRFV